MTRSRWLVLTLVGVVAAVAGILRLGERSPDSDPQASSDGVVGEVAGPAALVRAPTPRDEPLEILGTAVTSVDSQPPARKVDVANRPASHIGPRRDPDADNPSPVSDTGPRHVGEYLDPDDEWGSAGPSVTLHVGEHLDPHAGE